MNLIDNLKDRQNILADGAMGILLMQRGSFKNCPEEINLSNPGLLEEIASEYLHAGAKIIQTATFGASRLRLAQFQLDPELKKINRVAVQAVKNAVNGDVFINGVMGPTGLPFDSVKNEIANNYREQAEFLVNEGVDLLSLETMMNIGEAKAALEGIKKVSGDTPVVLSFAFIQGEKGFTTVAGEPLDDVVSTFGNSVIDFFGVNCGNGFEEALALTKELKSKIDIPLAVQPNAGTPDENLNFPQTIEDFREIVIQLQKLGVSIIGGCCGTTPEYIEAVKSLF